VFTARYALSPYIKQIRFVFKRLPWNQAELCPDREFHWICCRSFVILICEDRQTADGHVETSAAVAFRNSIQNASKSEVFFFTGSLKNIWCYPEGQRSFLSSSRCHTRLVQCPVFVVPPLCTVGPYEDVFCRFITANHRLWVVMSDQNSVAGMFMRNNCIKTCLMAVIGLVLYDPLTKGAKNNSKCSHVLVVCRLIRTV
jgi:hypothetical protein